MSNSDWDHFSDYSEDNEIQISQQQSQDISNINTKTEPKPISPNNQNKSKTEYTTGSTNSATKYNDYNYGKKEKTWKKKEYNNVITNYEKYEKNNVINGICDRGYYNSYKSGSSNSWNQKFNYYYGDYNGGCSTEYNEYSEYKEYNDYQPPKSKKKKKKKVDLFALALSRGVAKDKEPITKKENEVIHKEPEVELVNEPVIPNVNNLCDIKNNEQIEENNDKKDELNIKTDSNYEREVNLESKIPLEKEVKCDISRNNIQVKENILIMERQFEITLESISTNSIKINKEIKQDKSEILDINALDMSELKKVIESVKNQIPDYNIRKYY